MAFLMTTWLENNFKPGDWGDEVRYMYELEKCVADLKVWMKTGLK